MRNLLFVILFFALSCKKDSIQENASVTVKMIVNFKSNCKLDICDFTLFSGKSNGNFVYYTTYIAPNCCGFPAVTVYDENGKNERHLINKDAEDFYSTITEKKKLVTCP